MTSDPFSGLDPVLEGAPGEGGGDAVDCGPSEGTEPRAEVLPPGFPVAPLGHADGVFHFLTARGELAAHSAWELVQRATLVALFTGSPHRDAWLAWISEAKQRDLGFSPAGVADFLMTACALLPLYDQSMQVRRRGTWRGAHGVPVVHLGDRVIGGGFDGPAGQVEGGAVYPAAPPGAPPGDRPIPAEDMRALRDGIAELWQFERPGDADLLVGWVAQACLGQFPAWRAHLWINGVRGAGKSTLVQVIASLLGGMLSGARKGGSEAAARHATTGQALAQIFDEGCGEAGQIERIVALFRLMSDQDGAIVERGTGQHKAATFRLYGAGCLASIQPVMMAPQDRSRFVMVKLRPHPPVDDPLAVAERLADLEAAARDYGPGLWARMLAEAPVRWDDAHRRYSALVQALGGDRRAGDTIGVILAGWDLALFDGPPDDGRMRLAGALAVPLLSDVVEAEAEGDGERCLRMLLGALVPKDLGILPLPGDAETRMATKGRRGSNNHSIPDEDVFYCRK